MKDENNKYEIGVIVGRFQLDQLHKGHLSLIEYVLENHKKVILFLGISSNGQPTRRYPMGFATREKMIKESFPNVVVSPIKDMNDDKKWSDQLDLKIKEIFHHGKAKLYGGRDSFIKHYTGKHSTEQIEDAIDKSATDIREEIAREVVDTPDFRKGVIYGAYNRYPNAFQTVDIAVFKTAEGQEDQILLARKPNEDKFRFVGGYVDPSDASLEAAAKRELNEEATGMETADYEYVTSQKVDDWRYEQEQDKIITALFKCKYIYGNPTANDDIAEVKWFTLKSLGMEGAINRYIVPEHSHLMITLLTPYFKTITKTQEHETI